MKYTLSYLLSWCNCFIYFKLMDGSLSCHKECMEGPGLKSQPLPVAAGGGVSLKGLAHPVCNVCTIIHVGGRGLWLRKLAAQTLPWLALLWRMFAAYWFSHGKLRADKYRPRCLSWPFAFRCSLFSALAPHTSIPLILLIFLPYSAFRTSALQYQMSFSGPTLSRQL